MRIIAGEFRGRKLLPPLGLVTRPITDRVKQSLFDIITPLLPEARVYDCFAGTGSLGLEALSRGAKFVTFFEADRSACELLQRNIQSLGLARRCRVAGGNFFKWLATAPAPAERVDLVFLDPPYRMVREKTAELQAAVARLRSDHLSASGTIVFRHDAADRLEVDSMDVYDRREYGGMAIELMRPSPQMTNDQAPMSKE